jgi:uncharacterized protein
MPAERVPPVMGHVQVRGDGDLSQPWLLEGLPGVGLVGSIAADHLVETLGMDHYADVHCEGLPRVATYGADDRTVRAPVRLYADVERDLLVLYSDVPVSPANAPEFAACLTAWLDGVGARPLYVGGLPVVERASPPATFGVAVGDGADWLEETDTPAPDEPGVLSGPTGALVAAAAETGLDAAGVVVETDPRFPDPEGARGLLADVVEPLTGVAVDHDELVEHAERVREGRERLAERMREAAEESSKAEPLRMYQ